jgi:hypothetical protein
LIPNHVILLELQQLLLTVLVLGLLGAGGQEVGHLGFAFDGLCV